MYDMQLIITKGDFMFESLNINIIAAIDKNYGIGSDNDLLYYLKADMEHFKKITFGSVVVMGYKTYDSLKVKPLPNRHNIVLTSKSIVLPGCTVVNDITTLESILIGLGSDKEIFIIGGETIYAQFMPFAKTLYITYILAKKKAEKFFPAIDSSWQLKTINTSIEALNNDPAYIFSVYKRKFMF